MEKFTQLHTTAVPLPIEDVDTDQIIPARFLKATTREGFGDNLFRDWRYHSDGTPVRDFVLNNDHYKGELLVAGRNFGCGSSREHAAWAIQDFGFRVVISSFFADIFQANSLNNGLLPIQVSPAFLDQIFQEIEKDANAVFTIDLVNQRVTIESSGESEHFDINSYKKMCLIEGYDDIDFLLSLRPQIAEYEDAQAV